jgi:hypothetical protein
MEERPPLVESPESSELGKRTSGSSSTHPPHTGGATLSSARATSPADPRKLSDEERGAAAVARETRDRGPTDLTYTDSGRASVGNIAILGDMAALARRVSLSAAALTQATAPLAGTRSPPVTHAPGNGGGSILDATITALDTSQRYATFVLDDDPVLPRPSAADNTQTPTSALHSPLSVKSPPSVVPTQLRDAPSSWETARRRRNSSMSLPTPGISQLMGNQMSLAKEHSLGISAAEVERDAAFAPSVVAPHDADSGLSAVIVELQRENEELMRRVEELAEAKSCFTERMQEAELKAKELSQQLGSQQRLAAQAADRATRLAQELEFSKGCLASLARDRTLEQAAAHVVIEENVKLRARHVRFDELNKRRLGSEKDTVRIRFLENELKESDITLQLNKETHGSLSRLLSDEVAMLEVKLRHTQSRLDAALGEKETNDLAHRLLEGKVAKLGKERVALELAVNRAQNRAIDRGVALGKAEDEIAALKQRLRHLRGVDTPVVDELEDP